jgi:hypothetical protein
MVAFSVEKYRRVAAKGSVFDNPMALIFRYRLFGDTPYLAARGSAGARSGRMIDRPERPSSIARREPKSLK